MARSFTVTLFVAYLFVLFNLTLVLNPSGGHPRVPLVNLVPFRTILSDLHAGGRPLVVNFLGNLGAFLPMGIGLTILGRQRASAVNVAMVSGAISLAIESGQYLFGTRVADIDDVLLNTLGGLLGFVLMRVAILSIRHGVPRRSTASAILE